QRRRHLLRPRHQRPDVDDPPSLEHGDRQVLDLAGPHGLRARRPHRRRDARTVRLAVVIRPGDYRTVGASAIMGPLGSPIDPARPRPDNGGIAIMKFRTKLVGLLATGALALGIAAPAYAITFGRQDLANEFPNVASVRGIVEAQNLARVSCSGSLLSRDATKIVILTAAHCTDA